MRKFSRLAIVISQEGNEDSVFSAPIVEMTNGSNSVQVSDFESALNMLPPGSEVYVIANGTVGNKIVHRLARAIREACVFVSLDLSSVKELSHVSNSPFKGNLNLVSISFPNNLDSISAQGFADCKNLESVTLPATVQKIGVQAFSGCEKLNSMEFEDTDGWVAVRENGNEEIISGLEKTEDNPYRFTLQSSPFRNCMLRKTS